MFYVDKQFISVRKGGLTSDMGQTNDGGNACSFANFQDRMKGLKLRAGVLEEEQFKVRTPRDLNFFTEKVDVTSPAALMLVVFQASSHTKTNG